MSNGPTKRTTACDESTYNFTVTLDFNKDGVQRDEAAVIRGIRPEVLQKASLFQQLLADKTSDDGEELVVPMLEGTARAMESVLRFLGTECSSEDAKKHRWPLPLNDLLSVRENVLFHPSVLRFLRQLKREYNGHCRGVLDVLSLAHYIGADTMAEMVATFLAKQVVEAVNDKISCVDHVADHFKSLPLHVRTLIGKRLVHSCDTLEFCFPSLAEGLAAADDVWLDPNVYRILVLTCWSSAIFGSSADLRLLRRRYELHRDNLPSSHIVACVDGIAKAGPSWAWLREAIRTFSSLTILVLSSTTREDWNVFLDLFRQNDGLRVFSLATNESQKDAIPIGLFETLSTKPLLRSFSLTTEDSTLDCTEWVDPLDFVEHFTCDWITSGECFAALLTALPNLKSLTLLGDSGPNFNQELVHGAAEVLERYNPTTHDGPFILRWEFPIASMDKVKAELQRIATVNPRFKPVCVRHNTTHPKSTRSSLLLDLVDELLS